MLPPETLELVLGYVSRRDLVQVLAVSADFHHVAARVLYSALVDITPKRALRLVKTLARNDLYPPLVRRLQLEWSDNILTANLLRLLHRTLQRLTHLAHLGLEFSAFDVTSDLAWILHECPFSLTTLTTSLRCDASLARFLATQFTLTEICFRGHNLGPAFAAPDPVFSLPTHALPRLTHFRTVLASPLLTATFLCGRPVECVSVSLYPGDATPCLDALRLSTRPLRRLTVMSFDLGSPAGLIAEIGTRLPSLEALHAVVFVRQSSHAHLLETAPSLSHFKALRYLTFMAPGSLSSEHEYEIATSWHRACPTLKTIILPKGIVWGYCGGRWVSLHDTS